MALFVLSLLQSTPVCLPKKCESYDFEHPFNGRYCPTKGILMSNLPWHQCKLYCLQTPNCHSVNYNFTDNICSYFTATCPKAINHPSMAFVLFTGRKSEECIQWIPKGSNQPSDDDRSVSEDNQRFVARLQKDGNDFLGYMLQSICYCKDGEGVLKSKQGYPCQYLRVSDSCTVYYVDYKLGAPLSSKALIGGYTADGLPVYFVIKDGGNAPNTYIPTFTGFAYHGEITTEKVRVLVSLWMRSLAEKRSNINL